jgi:hypothetical protein
MSIGFPYGMMGQQNPYGMMGQSSGMMGYNPYVMGSPNSYSYMTAQKTVPTYMGGYGINFSNIPNAGIYLADEFQSPDQLNVFNGIPSLPLMNGTELSSYLVPMGGQQQYGMQQQFGFPMQQPVMQGFGMQQGYMNSQLGMQQTLPSQTDGSLGIASIITNGLSSVMNSILAAFGLTSNTQQTSPSGSSIQTINNDTSKHDKGTNNNEEKTDSGKITTQKANNDAHKCKEHHDEGNHCGQIKHGKEPK